MPSLSEVILGHRGKGFSAVKKAVSLGASLAKRQKRMVFDYLGSLIVEDWDKIPGGYVTTVDPAALQEVLRIYNDFCGCSSNGLFNRYSKLFGKIFYVAKFDAEVVGYSTYYVKPLLTLYGIRKSAVLYSMAVDGRYRRQGIGRHLLTVSILEMQLNGMDEIVLYVSKRNTPALSLYTKLGFVVTDELPDICRKGECCYRMRLELPVIPA